MNSIKKKSVIENVINEMTGKMANFEYLQTGYSEFDEVIKGLKPCQLITIAGHPGIGKTAFALGLTYNIGIIKKIPTVYMSLSITKEQLLKRLLLFSCDFPINKMQFNEDEESELFLKGEKIANSDFDICDITRPSLMELVRYIREQKNTNNTLLFVIDPVEYICLKYRISLGTGDFSLIAKTLKDLSVELEISIVVLSNLRLIDSKLNRKTPDIADLQESIKLERYSDLVILLNREDYYFRGQSGFEDNGSAELIVHKNNSGQTGNIKMNFNEEIAKFQDIL